jgi:hypothetical protein
MNGELADDPMRTMCSFCESMDTYRYIWWSNQYGEKRRVFCRTCGGWEDRTLIYSSRWFKAETVREPQAVPS